MRKTKLISGVTALSGLMLCGLVVGAIQFNSGSKGLHAADLDHVHNGYHYAAQGTAYQYQEATREFWTCCGCPEEGIWFEEPGQGTFADRALTDFEGTLPDEVHEKAPWIDATPVVRVGSSVTIDGDTYKLPANGSVTSVNEDSSIWVGPAEGTLSSEYSRRYLSIDLTYLGEGWGNSTDLYVRGYGIKNGAFGEYIGARLAYSAAAAFHNPTDYIKTYNPTTGAEFGDGAITVYNRRTELVIDLGHIDTMVKVGIYSDSGSKVQINNIAFKDTLCGHPASDYVTHSSVADGAYTASASYSECTQCGATRDAKETIPAAKQRIDLSNPKAMNADLSLSGNVFTSEGASGTGRYVSYTIPSKFIGKGKLVARLKLSSAQNAFDIRIRNASDGALVTDFGQTTTAGDPLNRGYEAVIVTTDQGLTTFESGCIVNHYVIYEFDLTHSSLATADNVAMGLWWGTQTLEVDQLYCEYVCDHSAGNTQVISQEKTATQDGYERTFCTDCGHIISETRDDLDTKELALPETLAMGNSSQNNIQRDVFDHSSQRTKAVIQFKVEKCVDEEWSAFVNYGTYIAFYNEKGVQLNTGLYRKNSSTNLFDIACNEVQMHEGNGSDARTLSATNGSESGSYGLLPSFVKMSYNSTEKVTTMTIDLTDSIGAQVSSLAFRNTQANSRINILSAYATK